MKKKLNKTTKSNLITYAMVVIVYIIVQLLVSGGAVSSLMKGLLVQLCVYSILAVSLNLTVGILGELSLGHAGFMCIGAFTSATFSKLTNRFKIHYLASFTVPNGLGTVALSIRGTMMFIRTIE